MTPNLRVLHVFGQWAPNGAERQLLSTVIAARGRLWEPTILLLRPRGAFISVARDAGIELITLTDRHDYSPWRVVEFRAAVRRSQCDVVHSTLWGANAFTRTSLYWGRRPAIVISERRVEDFRGKPALAIDRILRSRADHYIGNSAAVADFMVRAHGVSRDLVSVIPNGIDGTVFFPGPRSRHQPSTVFRVGSVGRLVPIKSFDLLVAAARMLYKRFDVTFEIVGEGSERERLARLACGLPVKFLGPMPDPLDVAEFMRSLDLFVLPSRAEGLSNVLLEAAACGTPVLATDAPGIAEAIPGAVLVPAGDAASLAAAIADAITNGRLAPLRSQVAQSFERAAELHLEAFREASARHAQRT